MYVCINVHICVYVCMYVCVCMCACMCVCMYVVCIYVYVCMYVCMYMYVYLHIICVYVMYVCIYVTGFGKIGLNAANIFFSVSRGKALWVNFFQKKFMAKMDKHQLSSLWHSLSSGEL